MSIEDGEFTFDYSAPAALNNNESQCIKCQVIATPMGTNAVALKYSRYNIANCPGHNSDFHDEDSDDTPLLESEYIKGNRAIIMCCIFMMPFIYYQN